MATAAFNAGKAVGGAIRSGVQMVKRILGFGKKPAAGGGVKARAGAAKARSKSNVIRRGGLKKFRAAAGLKGGKSSSGEL